LKLYLLILCIILAGCKTSQQLATEIDKFTNTIIKGVTDPSSIQKKSVTTVQPRQRTKSNSVSIETEPYLQSNDVATEPYLQPNTEPESNDVATEPYLQPNTEPESNDVATEPYLQPNSKQDSSAVKKKTAITKSEICIKVHQGDREAILTALNKRISCSKSKNETAITQPKQKDAGSKTLEYSDEEICIGVKMKNRDFIKLALTKKLRC